jgi:hypothetical protein
MFMNPTHTSVIPTYRRPFLNGQLGEVKRKMSKRISPGIAKASPAAK